MSAYKQLQKKLQRAPHVWLVTGVAGFIGSNLLERLLELNQRVVGLDNLSTGYRRNLQAVRTRVTARQWARFRFVKGDVGDLATCRRACAGVDFVLHQAALGSVPGSMADPVECHRSNVTGFLNVLASARQTKVRRVVYASSSAVYGDNTHLPNQEARIGEPLSPYAASKAMDEEYARVFARAYGMESVGLRYFNVFGPRQDPAGAYAAVIPAWIAAMLNGEKVFINGDGKTTRDFCYITDVVQANLLAATTQKAGAANQVYNVASGKPTALNELFEAIRRELRRDQKGSRDLKPIYREFRPGDVRHSAASIHKAQRLLGYAPSYGLAEGLREAMGWYRGET